MPPDHDGTTGQVREPEAPPPPDWSRFTDRELLERIAAQNHDIGESQLALLDAVEALNGTADELLRETRGEGEPKKGGKTLQDDVREFTDAIKALTEEMREGRAQIPVETASKVSSGLEDTLGRVLAAADAGGQGAPAPAG